jgi:hypothetical protein
VYLASCTVCCGTAEWCVAVSVRVAVIGPWLGQAATTFCLTSVFSVRGGQGIDPLLGRAGPLMECDCRTPCVTHLERRLWYSWVISAHTSTPAVPGAKQSARFVRLYV